jgi:outer membrane protein
MRPIILSVALLITIPVSAGAQQPITISLRQAVDAALEPDGNTRIQLAEQMVRQAEARAAVARASLLPDMSASIGQQSRTINLSAYGLQSGEQSAIVGPYSTFDARATMTQKIIDLSSLRNYKAARVGADAAKHENENVKDQTATDVARVYLSAVRAQAVVETAQANVTLSQALLRLANSQKESGTGTGIEVTRAQVQLANDRQSLLSAGTQFSKASLELLKAIGFELDAQIELSDRLSYASVDAISVKQAVTIALESLESLKAQRMREQSASLHHSAVRLERMPSIIGFADYGTTGLRASQSSPTRTVGASVRIPLFDGGARQARGAESRAELAEERVRTADLIRETELNIRVAIDAMRSAEAQVQAAEDGLTLSTNELEQAQRRYQAGVASSVEITDAQTRLQRARDNKISAVFSHALARIDLAAAMGTIQELVNNWR